MLFTWRESSSVIYVRFRTKILRDIFETFPCIRGTRIVDAEIVNDIKHIEASLVTFSRLFSDVIRKYKH